MVIRITSPLENMIYRLQLSTFRQAENRTYIRQVGDQKARLNHNNWTPSSYPVATWFSAYFGRNTLENILDMRPAKHLQK